MAAGVTLEMGRQQAPISHLDEAGAHKLVSPYGVGTVLCGRYRLDALIGEGAMGAVWQATNLLLDAPVAIKLTHADLDGAFRERLRLEARAAAWLVHPAIVRVFDVAKTELGDPFIVMELLQGSTLAQLLMRGRFPAVRAVQVILPIVDALSSMHARGVVHRDLKPDNLLVSLEDERVQPKILDFGIAKLSAPRAKDHFMNESGALIGSPEYMSPEQAAANEDVDDATDIWSICVVLYEAVAGQTPFRSCTAEGLLRAIIEDEPAPLVAMGLADERLWEIIRTGLSKGRHERQKSMFALGRELAAWLIGSGVHEDVCGTSLESKWFGDSGAAVVAGTQPGVPANRDVTPPPWFFDGAPTQLRTTPMPAKERVRRAPLVAAACALIALVFWVGAQKGSQMAEPSEASPERSAGARPVNAAAAERVTVRPAGDVVEAPAVVSSAVAAVASVPAKTSFAASLVANDKRRSAPRAPSAAGQKPVAQANGADLGLLSPY